MARLLIFDTEAVNALARRTERGATRLRTTAIAARARQESAVIAIPLPVHVEAYRGDGTDALVDRLVASVEVIPLALSTARLAGAIRAAAGTGSAVDAIVVATAIKVGGAVIATGDPADLSALAQNHSNVSIWGL